VRAQKISGGTDVCSTIRKEDYYSVFINSLRSLFGLCCKTLPSTGLKVSRYSLAQNGKPI